MKPVLERIMRHVEVTPDGHWIWKGATTNGTPVIRDGAHSVSVRQVLNPEGGKLLRATCCVDMCVAPDHIGERLDMRSRITNMAGTDDVEPCWTYRRIVVQPHIDGRSARRVAYETLVGPLPKRMLKTYCRHPGCFNPFHVIPPVVEDNPDELQDIEDCAGMLESGDDVSMYDEPTIAAAKRLLIETAGYTEEDFR